MKLDINQSVTVVCPNLEEKNIQLKDLLGEKNILFFYPKDNTPGCTTENKDFSQLKEDFEKLGYTIIGVSKDSPESHKKFIQKHNLTICLISDPDLVLHKQLGVW